MSIPKQLFNTVHNSKIGDQPGDKQPDSDVDSSKIDNEPRDTQPDSIKTDDKPRDNQPNNKADGRPRLAILDDYADIAAKPFEGIHGLKVDSDPVTLSPSTSDGLNDLVARLESATIISSMRERTAFPADLLARLPNLNLLLTTGMKNAAIDLKAANEQGIIVTGTKGAQALNSSSEIAPPPAAFDSTTQHTWALLLSLCGRIAQDDAALRADHSAWQSGFSFALGGKTIGILGLGRLGANTARIASQAFGMHVIAWSENLTQEKADAAAQTAGLPTGSYRVVSKEDLFRKADVLSVHYVLSERSRGIVGQAELALMKPTAVLVNTARGPLIDEGAFLEALNRGTIRGAALDVWWQEPLPCDSPWRSYSGKGELVMSPHMGYVNGGTMHRWYDEQAEIVQQWLDGHEVINRLN